MTSSQLSLVRIAVVILLGGATVTAFRFTASVNSATEGGVVMELPVSIGQFSGKEQAVSEGEKYVLPKDTEIVKKTYTDPSGDLLNAQIVLAGAEKRSIHRPEHCLPAQGWSINRRQTIPVTLANGRSITVMADFISRPVEVRPGVTRTLESIYCYWFINCFNRLRLFRLFRIIIWLFGGVAYIGSWCIFFGHYKIVVFFNIFFLVITKNSFLWFIFINIFTPCNFLLN